MDKYVDVLWECWEITTPNRRHEPHWRCSNLAVSVCVLEKLSCWTSFVYSSYLQLEVARTTGTWRTNVRCQKTVACSLLNCATQTPVVHMLFLNMVLRMVLVSWLFLQECRRWHSTEPVTVQRASRVLLPPQWFSVHAFPARQRNVFCFWCDIVHSSLAGGSRQQLSSVVIFNYRVSEKDCTFFKNFSLGPWCDIRIFYIPKVR